MPKMLKQRFYEEFSGHYLKTSVFVIDRSLVSLPYDMVLHIKIILRLFWV